jgi:protocatechuate 3,4-dioxygenase beta subunit
MKYIGSAILVVLAICLFSPMTSGKLLSAATCEPTNSDVMGPFYKPNAPIRASVGKGYLVQGTIRSSIDCRPVPGAVIELWLAGPEGGYDDSHRATVITDASGRYRFESNVPPPIEGRPPHIHLRISAKGFNSLVTQNYPVAGTKEAVFDIALVPSR